MNERYPVNQNSGGFNFGGSNQFDYGQEVFTNAFDVKTQKKIVRKFIIKLYEQPFVDLLKFFVSHGADAHAKVDKLLYYRRLEEHREKILRDENILAEEVKAQAEADV